MIIVIKVESDSTSPFYDDFNTYTFIIVSVGHREDEDKNLITFRSLYFFFGEKSFHSSFSKEVMNPTKIKRQ